MVVVPRVSGSRPSTPAGGGGAGCPNRFASTKLPRGTGDVVVPFAVTFSTLACVSSPPRGRSAGNATRRMCCPSTAGNP